MTQCYYFHWVDTSARGLFVYEGVIRPMVSVSALTWFIRYISYSNLQFLNNVVINKTKVPFPQAYVTLADIGYLVYTLCFTCYKRYLNLFTFKSFDYECTW
jgi:hypothetical protein